MLGNPWKWYRAMADRSLFCLASVLSGCETGVSPQLDGPVAEPVSSELVVISQGDTLFSLSAAKWPGGSQAAVSITYDAPWGTHDNHHLATDAVIERGLRMDLEVVSWIYENEDHFRHLPSVYRDVLQPQGISFFGHGHTHALHDTMTYAQALASFKTNFDLMMAWGLEPRAYAYPGSSGLRESTQRACQEAGFICARGMSPHPLDAIMLAGEKTEPHNWYFLPSVAMGNASHLYIDNHEKLLPILDKALEVGGWVILMYHAIGIPEGWSYYPIVDFERDLEAISSRSFWSANLDAAAAYVKERNNLTLEITRLANGSAVDTVDVRIGDGLGDILFDEPIEFYLTTSSKSVSLPGLNVTAYQHQPATFRIVPTDATYTLYVTP